MKMVQMSEKDNCSNCMESSDLHHWINFVSPCTLDRLAEHLFTLSPGFKLTSLPPTAAGAKFHSYRAYPVLQQWNGEPVVSD